MKTATEAVADVFANDCKSIFVRFCHDIFTDDADGASGCQGGNGSVHCIEGALGDGSGLVRYATDQERFGLITVPTVDDGGDIHVDDISVLQGVRPGDAVADHVVDACAAAFGVTKITECGGGVFMGDSIFVYESIDFPCGDTRLDKSSNVVHELGVELTGRPHALTLDFRKLEFS